MPRATGAIARNPFDPFAASAVVGAAAGAADGAAADGAPGDGAPGDGAAVDAGAAVVVDAGAQLGAGTAAAAGELGVAGVAAVADAEMPPGISVAAVAGAGSGVEGEIDGTRPKSTDAETESETSSSEVSEPIYEADAVLLGATDRARNALLEITPRATIGDCVGHTVEGERVLSLRFESVLSGYPGWFWTVTLSREEAGQDVNVLEMELLPGPDALLAPEWVPWSVRLAEYHAQQRARRAAAEAAGDEPPEDELAAELGVGDDEFDDDFEELEDDALSDIAGAHDVPLDFDDPVSDFELDEGTGDGPLERDFDLEVVELEDASGA